MFKLTGTVIMIGETEQVTEKFAKREFVIEDASTMYPQTILFQTVQDKCQMLDSVIEGQEVEVSFNLRGRKWESPQGEVKYFNTLECWRLEPVGSAPETAVTSAIADDESNDSPF